MALLGGAPEDGNRAAADYIRKHNLHVAMDEAVESLLVSKPADPRERLRELFTQHHQGTPPPRQLIPEPRSECEAYLRKHRIAELIEHATGAVLKEKPAAEDVHLFLAKFFGGLPPASKTLKGGSAGGGEGDLEDFTPKVFCGQAINLPMAKGEVVWYCRCGYSQNQPYCDGQHRDLNAQYGVKIFPAKYEAAEDGVVRFCGCRKSDRAPLCDYSHLQCTEAERALRVPLTFEYEPWVVTHRTQLTHDSVAVTLRKQAGSGLPVASTFHFSIRNEGSGKARPYTPIAYDDVEGTATFVIKAIPDGAVSPYLNEVAVNAVVPMKGPSPGEYHYTAAESGLTYVLLAGGSGITPIYQVMAAVAAKPQGNTVHFAYSNKTAGDVLIEKELRDVVAALEGQGCLGSQAFAISRAPDDADLSPPFRRGRIDRALVEEMVHGAALPRVRAIICGTPGFNKAMYEACKGVGVAKEHVIFC